MWPSHGHRCDTFLAFCLLSIALGQSAPDGESLLTADGLHDCEDGSVDAWLAPKRAWCCLYKKVGCSGYYHCHAGLQHFEKFWSQAKQAWCCEHEQLGCVLGAAAVARKMPVSNRLGVGSGDDPFDCADGLWDWELWPADKQQWCCAHKLRWCPKKIPAVNDSAFDCHADGLHNWSDTQRSWCCAHQQLGCPKSPKSAACDVTCSTRGRSATCEKRVTWIKKHKFGRKSEADACKSAHSIMIKECDVCSACHIADVCAESGKREDLDCQAGSIATWSITRKQDCCKSKGVGCASLFPPYDCHYQPQGEWTSGKRLWCCRHEGRGCGATATSAALVARTTSLSMRIMTTSSEVTTTNRAAGPSLAIERVVNSGTHSVSYLTPQGNSSDKGMRTKAIPFGCNDADNQANWSVKQVEWCCDHHSIGCPVAANVSEPYDCMHNFRGWQKMWSPQKARWCCGHFGRGCIASASITTTMASPTGTTSTTSTTSSGISGSTSSSSTGTERFDCAEDLEVWMTSWSYTKALWCCSHHQKGCLQDSEALTTTTANFDCDDGLSSYWPEFKAQWCCDHYASGCSTTTRKEAYTCEVSSQAPWSDGQRAWCCLHQSRGCTRSEPKETTTPPPYDCSAGLGSWSTEWSAGKQAWCCLYAQIGCPSEGQGASASKSSTEVSYDCQAGLYDFEELWPVDKRTWCCAHGASLIRDHLRDRLACSEEVPAEEVPEHFTMQTFQRKFRQQFPDQLVHRLRRWLVPTICFALSLMALSGAIRICSRGYRPGSAEELWHGRSSRVFRAIDIEADEEEFLLELPGRMEQQEWARRC